MNTNRATRIVLSAGLLGLVGLGAFTLPGCASGPSATPVAAPSGKYTFWPAPQVDPAEEPRIQFLGAFNSSEDISATKSTALESIVFGKDAVRPAFVNKPYGVAIRDGRIYVCDIRAKSLVVLDLAKKQTRLVGTTGGNKLERPVAVAVSDDGMLYVADGIHMAVLVYDKSERFASAIRIPKLKPSSIAISGDRLYITDMGRQQVIVVDRTSGKEIGVIGSVGDDDGQFRLPVGVATDKAGAVYVTDMMKCCIQKFSPDGKFLAKKGEQGDHAGGFARPKHLAVDSEGIVYVVDGGFQNVQMFNSEFALLMHFGAAGDFPGAMNLPVGVAVTDSGLEYFKDRIHPGFVARRLVVVASQFGDNKISVYALGDRSPKFSLADFQTSANKVYTGVGTPSAESLKFQNIGGVEPGQNEGGEEAKPETPAEPGKTPDPKPATPAPAPK